MPSNLFELLVSQPCKGCMKVIPVAIPILPNGANITIGSSENWQQISGHIKNRFLNLQTVIHTVATRFVKTY